MFSKRFGLKNLVSLLGVLIMLSLLTGCGGGGGGGSAITPVSGSATVSGTINSASAAPAVSYQAANKEYKLTLVDADGNAVPETDLEAPDAARPNEPRNDLTVKDGQPFSFKVKNFSRSYKVIAKGTGNEMLSVFIGKLKDGDKVTGRNADPEATAYMLLYGDNKKETDAGVFKTEEEARRNDPSFGKKLAEFVADISAKRQSALKDRSFATADKLEKAYKDAVLGTIDPAGIKKLVEGLEVVFQKNPDLLAAGTIADKLKEVIALAGTDGRRQNETSVKEAKAKLKALLAGETADPKKLTDNKDGYKDAKIALSLVSNNLGDIYKNKVSGGAAKINANAPSLMAAYQAISDNTLDSAAKAEYLEGYNSLPALETDAADRQSGRDKQIAAALLKNASELAKEDPAKLDEARKKSDSIVARLDSEGIREFELLTGEKFTRDEALQEKGDALINAGRPDEAVRVFQEVEEPKIKNFGLGRAFLQLNDIENAYKSLKSSVEEILRSSDSSDARANIESKFEKVNEALFAFAAIIDRLKSDVSLLSVKNSINGQEQGGDNFLNGASAGNIISAIKPSTNFYTVGNAFVSQGKLGTNSANTFTETDPLKIKFDDAMKLLFKASDILERSKTTAIPETLIGTVDLAADGTVIKLLADSKAIFDELYKDPALKGTLKGNVYYQLAVLNFTRYEALKLIKTVDKTILAEAKRILLDIRANISGETFAHLEYSVSDMLDKLQAVEEEDGGFVASSDTVFAEAEKIRKRAENMRDDELAVEASDEFNKALNKYDEFLAKKETAAIAKLREAAHYFAANCLYNMFRLSAAKDEGLKNKVVERYKLFLLKYPNSEFVYTAQDALNQLNNSLSDQTKPGEEFQKAVSLIEKLRFYYKNGYSTAEIEFAFTGAEKILRAIAVDITKDAKFTGNIVRDDDMRHFRANAKFQLAILYMERYLIPRTKEIKFKNLALQFLSEIIEQNADESFIKDVKRFIEQLNNEGSFTDEFVAGKPMITAIVINPPFIELDKTAAATTVSISANVIVPETKEGELLITKVSAEVRQFGNAIYAVGDNNTPMVIELKRSADHAKRFKWEGGVTVTEPKPGSYDIVVTAESFDGKRTTAVANYVVKQKSAFAFIERIEVISTAENTIFKLTASSEPAPEYKDAAGIYTGAYVTLMQPELAAATLVSNFMPVFNSAYPVKLERIEGEPKAFRLELNKAFPNLTAGNYMFLFKLVNFNPADPDGSINDPASEKPFNFIIKKEVPGSARDIILPLYKKILETLSDNSRTPEERANAYEKMYEKQLSSERRSKIIKILSVIKDIKITIPDGVMPSAESVKDDMVSVRAPWKIEGIYKEAVLSGINGSDGINFLPPGPAGFNLGNFVIEDKHIFVKRFVGVETWLITEGEDTPVPPPDFELSKVVITTIAGRKVANPTPGIPSMPAPFELAVAPDMPIIEVSGDNFKPFSPEDRRVLQLSGPELKFPVILADSGSFNWTGNSIKFGSEKLKGLKGYYILEIFDTKYGQLTSVAVRISEGQASDISVYILELINGDRSAPAFNASRPFEVVNTKDLVLKGDRMLPPAGVKYAVKCFGSKLNSNEAAAPVYLSTSADIDNWKDNMIAIKADNMRNSQIAPNVLASIVIWDVAADKPVSSTISVIFFYSDFDPGTMKPAVINTVNGVSAQSVINLSRPQNGSSVIDIVLTGSNFSSPSHRHLDLIFQVSGSALHVPIADSASAADWSDTKIKGRIDTQKAVPSIMSAQAPGTVGDYIAKFPCGINIIDDIAGKPVNPFMISIRFVNELSDMPVINKVNGVEFLGSPITVEAAGDLNSAAFEMKLEGKNFGGQGAKSVWLKPSASPFNPRPAPFQLKISSWNDTLIIVSVPYSTAIYGNSALAIYEANPMPPVAEAVSNILDTAFGPYGMIQLSKDIFVDIKKTGGTAVTSAKINLIKVFSPANPSPAEFNATQIVGVPFEAESLQLIGEGLRSANDTFRIAFMRRAGTSEEKYIADSGSSNWTNNTIDLKNISSTRVTDAALGIMSNERFSGLWELYIVEPGIGNYIVSNIIKISFQQSQTGSVINAINGISVQADRPITLKADFTELLITGNNLGANTDKSLKLMFYPMADPANPDPLPIQLPHLSWTATVIKAGRPADQNFKFRQGFILILDASGSKTGVPAQVSFGTLPAGEIPMVTGLVYDSARKTLIWKPVISAADSRVYAYGVMIDAMLFNTPAGVTEFPATNLASGPHKAQVQAIVPNTYPPVSGQFSETIIFTTDGGSQNNIPAVTGVFYDPMMKVIRWTPVDDISIMPLIPVNTETGSGDTSSSGATVTPGATDAGMRYRPYSYMIRLDGAVLSSPVYQNEFFVGNLPDGDHKIEIQAVLTGTYPPEAGPFSSPYAFRIEDGSNTENIPVVTGLVYDPGMKKLKWNPLFSVNDTPVRPFEGTVTPTTGTTVITNTGGSVPGSSNPGDLPIAPPIAAYMYMVRIDGVIYGPTAAAEFTLPLSLPGGWHAAEVQAQLSNTYPPQAGPWCQPLKFDSNGTTSNFPQVTGVIFDAGAKKIMWKPVSLSDNASPAVYMVMIDGMMTPAPVSMTEYGVGHLMSGSHKVQIQAQIPGSVPLMAGPWSTQLEFDMGGGAAEITGLVFEPAASSLKWNAFVSAPGVSTGYRVIVDGIARTAAPVTTAMFTFTGLTAGRHVAQIEAIDMASSNQETPRVLAKSMPYNFSTVMVSSPVLKSGGK